MKLALRIFACSVSLLATALAIAASRAMPVWVSAGAPQLRMRIQGHGSPAVILETFGPASLETWNRIQPGIARFATVVAYDHAGYWGSQPGPKPRVASQIVQELHAALQNAGVPPPYVLVGYSFGGPYIRVFADRFPTEVAGMVFVDPAQEEFMAWLNRRFPWLNVVSEADRARQDEWGSQWPSLDQASQTSLPSVPITLISAAQPGGPLLQRLLPEWVGAHQRWLRAFPQAHHLVTTNSGHGIVFSEPQLVINAVRNVAQEAAARSSAIR